MNDALSILLKLSACFLGLFFIAELIYHFARVKAEDTRKIVHIGTGTLTLLFPIYLHYSWQVVSICLAFLALLLLSSRYRFLKSVNNINRKSAGSYLYPIIVIGVFLYYRHQMTKDTVFDSYLYFYLPILLMAVCDPVAAMAGNRFEKSNGQKTLVGSMAFFVTAVLLSIILFSVFNYQGQSLLMIILYALGIALFTTVAEKYSKYGTDNLTIPFAAMAFLWMSENIPA